MVMDTSDKKAVKECIKELMDINDTIRKSFNESTMTNELESRIKDVTDKLIDIL